MGLFGAYFGSFYGDFFGEDGSPSVTPVGPDQDAPIVARLLSRIVTRFRTPNRIAYMRALARPAGDLAAALLQLILTSSSNECSGIQLDVLGKIVGQKRLGFSDADYRRLLRTRITANRSSGAIDTLYRVARLVINDDAADLTVVNDGNASYTFLVAGIVLADSTIGILSTMLRAATAAGVRIWLQTTAVDDDEVFSTSIYSTLTDSPSLGTMVLHVGDTALFPDEGSAVIAEGDSIGGLEETVPYSGKLATSLLLTSPTIHNHSIGDIVALVGEPGRGFSPNALTTPVNITAGSSTITVGSASLFPAAGTIEIDAGLATAELLPYTSHTGTVFTLTGVTTQAHAQGALVASVDEGGALDSSRVL